MNTKKIYSEELNENENLWLTWMNCDFFPCSTFPSAILCLKYFKIQHKTVHWLVDVVAVVIFVIIIIIGEGVGKKMYKNNYRKQFCSYLIIPEEILHQQSVFMYINVHVYVCVRAKHNKPRGHLAEVERTNAGIFYRVYTHALLLAHALFNLSNKWHQLWFSCNAAFLLYSLFSLFFLFKKMNPKKIL